MYVVQSDDRCVKESFEAIFYDNNRLIEDSLIGGDILKFMCTYLVTVNNVLNST
jgi:hypothetical protein